MFKKSFLKNLAQAEKVPFKFLEKQLNRARVVIPLNKKHKLSKPAAIGEGLKVKINTNIGLSTQKTEVRKELKKMESAVSHGTDTLMDLSVSRNFQTLRDELIKKCPVPLGTVPIYEA